jgi:hypothetical protein
MLFARKLKQAPGSSQLTAHLSVWKFIVEPENSLLRNVTYPRNGKSQKLSYAATIEIFLSVIENMKCTQPLVMEYS